MRLVIDGRIIEKFGDDPVGNAGDELIYRCSNCEKVGKSPDESGKLYVNNKTLKYFCHRCQYKGVIRDSVKGYTFEDTPTDHELLDQLVCAVERKPKTVELSYDYELSPLKPLPNTDAWNYLINRGISPQMMKHHDIRVGSVLTKYKNRIIIPNKVITDSEGNEWTDMFVARYMYEIPKDENGKALVQKYLNPSGQNRNNSVFNLSRIPKGGPIIIAEGSLSAISSGYSAVATYGKYVSDNQLRLILRNEPRSIFVSLDSDAIDYAKKLCEKLTRMTTATIYLVELPEGQDANDLGILKYFDYLRKAKPYSKVLSNLETLVK